MARTAGEGPIQQRAVATREALLLGAARVFARIPYGQARLKDIALESGISEGSLYFHFGTKRQIAEAILSAQQEKMTAALTGALAEPGTGLQKFLRVVGALAALMSSNEVVQAGIALADQPPIDIESAAVDPYFAWIGIARSLLEQGVADGSVARGIDLDAMAEVANYLFVGAQTIAGMADRWKSLPTRARLVQATLEQLLAPVR